jgi:hypothetical protein
MKLRLHSKTNEPYAGADYNLTLSHSRLKSSTPTTNADDCFPNYSKIEQPIGKGRVRGRGTEGVELHYVLE